MSQVVFAREAGLDSTLLASYEHCRSQLSYSSAWKIITHFKINPDWLATGHGWILPPIPIPSPEELRVGARALFSETFDNYLAEDVNKVLRALLHVSGPGFPSFNVPVSAKGRVGAESWIQDFARGWIEAVPDAHLNEFLNKVYQHALKLLESYPRDAVEIQEQRVKEMKEHRIFVESREAMFRNNPGTQQALPAYPVPEKSKLLADESGLSDSVAAVSKTSPTWKHLVKRVRKTTAIPGAKAQLARELKTSRQAVNKWLSGAGAPSADLTLRLHKLVEKYEALQQQGRRSSNSTGSKTRKAR